MTPAPFEFRTGAAFQIQILIIEPLFEEANRCRRLIATMMRGLADQLVGAAIAPLPGCGESLRSIEAVSLSDWKEAVRTAATALGATHVASLRGGALLDVVQPQLPVWRFAPETGARIVRDLERTRLAGSNDLYAGHRISDAFLAGLRAAVPAGSSSLRTVRLESDAAEADLKVSGSLLWRRAEPAEDSALSAALAADIAGWVRTCAAH